MVIAVSGTRTLTNETVRSLVYATLDKYAESITKVIEGGALGPDTFAKEWALDRNVPHKTYPADWSIGRRAGPIRNVQLVAECDKVIAFWDGISPGTKHCIGEAKRKGKLWKVLEV